MIVETSGEGSRVFPEIRIRCRSSNPVAVSPRLQSALLLTVFAGIGVLAFLGVNWIQYGHRVAEKTDAAARLRNTNDDLRKQLSGLRRELADARQDRGHAQQETAALKEQTQMLRDQLSTADAKLQSLTLMDDGFAELTGDIQKLGAAPPIAGRGRLRERSRSRR